MDSIAKKSINPVASLPARNLFKEPSQRAAMESSVILLRAHVPLAAMLAAEPAVVENERGDSPQNPLPPFP